MPRRKKVRRKNKMSTRSVPQTQLQGADTGMIGGGIASANTGGLSDSIASAETNLSDGGVGTANTAPVGGPAPRSKRVGGPAPRSKRVGGPAPRAKSVGGGSAPRSKRVGGGEAPQANIQQGQGGTQRQQVGLTPFFDGANAFDPDIGYYKAMPGESPEQAADRIAKERGIARGSSRN